MSWKMLNFMQAQVHDMHEINKADYIPRHIKYTLPPASEKIYLGRPELYAAAQGLHTAIMALTMLCTYTRLNS